MEKSPLGIASKRTIAAVLSVIIISSCNKSSSPGIQSSNKNEAEAAKAKPTFPPVVSLAVTVSDATGNNVTSDGLGDYINGVSNVQAILDQSGTFAFNTNSSSNPNTLGTRWVNYDFNNPVDPTNTYRPNPSNTKNYHFSTGGSAYGTNPFIPIQYLGINGNISKECIYMGNSVSNTTSSWRVSFHKGNEDVQNGATAFAVVTRTKIKAVDGVDEWTIAPSGPCTFNSNVAALRSSDGTLLYGYYYIPFLLTLRGQ
jgi:hypothetical protein